MEGCRDIEVTPACFRDLVPEITDTGYLTHSIYSYPAKFIPQVVRHCIRTYTREGDLIADPFAGSGTVGLEAYLLSRNAFLLDLNPLLNYIIPLKVYNGKQVLDKGILRECLDAMFRSEQHYHPCWSNIHYWYSTELFSRLSAYWGWIHAAERTAYRRIIEAALVKASRHFSYAEHRAPKLFQSERKRGSIQELLRNDWLSALQSMISGTSFAYLSSINDLIAHAGDHAGRVEFRGGVDSVSFHFSPNVRFDALVTSPPYMHAQEYMRTAKLDLFWLGHSQEEIRALTTLEIPYRKPDGIVSTDTIDGIKARIARKNLIPLLDSYFCHTIRALQNAMDSVKPGGRVCIFNGNPTLDGITVEIWRVFAEYFAEGGWSVEGVYEDKIKVRRLFGTRKNKNPDGMKSEYLLVLRKR
jgi:hypothetical protein